MKTLRTKSRAPPFKKRRTGHPKFNLNGRATRPMVQSKMNFPPFTYEEMQSWVQNPDRMPEGFWIDDLQNDPLHTEGDIRDLFERVAMIEAERGSGE